MNELERLQHGFFNLTDDENLNHVAKLRGHYTEMLSYFGGKDKLPASVMRVKRTKLDEDKDPEGVKRSYVAISPYANDFSIKSKTLRKLKYISGTGAQQGALSTFSQELGRTMVLFYTNPGDVVVDPFAGHNSRMDLVVRAGRHYYGQDLNPDFMKHNRKRAELLRKAFKNITIKLKEGDSRQLKYPANTADFSITSPPYWNIEDYGDDPRQLGNAKGGYPEFLKLLGEVMDEQARVLKPGACAVWFVNDFRKNKQFIPFHKDVMQLGMDSGLIMWDIVVADYGRAQRDAFIKQCFDQKVLPKRHEYGIVFRKKGWKTE